MRSTFSPILLVFLLPIGKNLAGDKVDGPLGCSRRLNDQCVVAAKGGDPVPYIGVGILLGTFRGNLRHGTEKRGSCLGYQLLLAIKLISEMLAEVAIEAAGVTGAVNQLMEESGVIVGGIDETKAGGKMNGICAGTIVGTALCLDLGADCWTVGPVLHEDLAGCVRLDLIPLRGFDRWDIQTITLLCIEDVVVG